MENRSSSARVGYARLIDRFALPALPLPTIAVIDGSVRGRDQIRQGDQDVLRFQPTYRPDDTPLADLLFALRYEGINLHVLSLLFTKRGAQDIQPFVDASPQSLFARRLGYLYEWLMDEALSFATPSRSSYVPLLDPDLQFGLSNGTRNAKYRVIDNLPGNRAFCPLVKRTARLQSMLTNDLAKQTQQTLAKYDPDLLRRAAAFLFAIKWCREITETGTPPKAVTKRSGHASAKSTPSIAVIKSMRSGGMPI